MGDTMVEGIVSDGTTSFVRIYLSEVVPESQTYFRQQDTTLAASLVERFCIAIAIGVSMINTFNVQYFMDQETFDMVPVNGSDLSDNFKFVKENDICRILSYKGKVFGVEPPTFVVLEVTKTEPGIKGNTATNTLKPATVETGAEIRVPLFINEGDKIRVDTRTCEYMERA